jgi:hypothetical protein
MEDRVFYDCTYVVNPDTQNVGKQKVGLQVGMKTKSKRSQGIFLRRRKYSKTGLW